jgi:hypothetical protein
VARSAYEWSKTKGQGFYLRGEYLELIWATNKEPILMERPARLNGWPTQNMN